MTRNEAVRAMLAIIDDETLDREDFNAAALRCVAQRVFGKAAVQPELSSMGIYSAVTNANDGFWFGHLSRAEFHDRIAALLVPEEAA